jgi:CheY-like chemotaxis protein
MGMTVDHRNPRALLLAKDHETLYSLATCLERRGFEVLAATDGAGGVELLLDNLLSLDLVVSDVDLPGRDGASLLELVRVAGGERDLAMVIRAAGLTARERAGLRAFGADAVVGATDAADRVAAIAEEAVGARALGEHPRPGVAPGRRATSRSLVERATTAFAAWPLAHSATPA